MSHIIHIYLLHDPSKPKTTTKNNIRVVKNINTILNTVNKNGFIFDIEFVDENDPTVIDDLKFRKLERFPCAQLANKVFNGVEKVESLFKYVVSTKIKSVKPKSPEELIRENQMSDICQPGDECDDMEDRGIMGSDKDIAKEMAYQQAQRRQQHNKYKKQGNVPDYMQKIAQNQKGQTANRNQPVHQRYRPDPQNPSRRNQGEDKEPSHAMKNEITPMMETPPAQLMQLDNVGDGGRLETDALTSFWQNQSTTPGT